MTSTIVFDIETNGLLEATKDTPPLNRVHSLCMQELETGKFWSLSNPKRSQGPQIIEGLKVLNEADMIIGHNIIRFDIPALQRVYGKAFAPKGIVRDTLVMSRLIFPDLKERDFVNLKRGGSKLPNRMIGSHALMAWGYRISNMKGEYDGGWADWSQDMQEYCDQDVLVTADLWGKLLSRKPSDESVAIEHAIDHILWRQENNGIGFNVGAAHILNAALLSERAELHRALLEAFPAWEVRIPFTPKRDNKTRGYVKGVTIDKITTIEFNPNSRDHIAQKLTERYGWRGTSFTPEGKPQIDEKVLAALTEWPEAQLLKRNFLIQKRLGQLSEGKNSWLQLEQNGRIHGRVVGNGAVTGRMTHLKPNMNVPSVRAYFGKECRDLFEAQTGMVLVGCDADALELRCLAGYMAHFDKGAYIDVVLKGNKDEGTDMHTLNAIAIGLDPKKHYTFNSVKGTGRDHAKTFFYAFLYGAGATKLGATLGASMAAGNTAKKKLLKSVPALSKLSSAVAYKVQKNGHLVGLDGRRLAIRSEHAALNTLLQSAGALIMKKAQVILDERLTGLSADFVATVHDEWIIETTKDIATHVGEIAAQSIRDAGTAFNFLCPIEANFQIGRTWADIH